MRFKLNPWHMLFFALAGLVNKEAQRIIAFQNAQIKALLKIMGRRRVILTNDLRRIIAVKGKVLGRKAMEGTDDHCNTGHHPPLAQGACCQEMGLL